ncbi:MAG: D-alanyl-D-alanine carboxypeptidase/D-alanyl-D-alanine-endopeptidase [Bacteroidales bacterium]|jgi:D-alanyl-D-alanine carboxypeptidase/D-alanyl-D-alanine-endopeptidase (penicillin-binding protein 4)|nr:D-alanyl-D-alanine carboxypeptidase/D-alanyl-D-alanine-endopeptidase [Bacteroidales bacterium]
MMKRELLLFFLALSLHTSYQAAAQQASINRFVQTEGMETSGVAVAIVDVKTGTTVASYNPDRLLTPASVLKVVTTATALEVLGSHFQIATRLQYAGDIDIDGILHGDLYIQGGGDPTLGSEFVGLNRDDFLKTCLTALQKSGIKQVAGRIIADETCFDQAGISPKWLKEDLGNSYAAGSYGISYADNTYRLFLAPGKAGATPDILRTEPDIPYINFSNFLEIKNKDSAFIYGIPFHNERWLMGYIPERKTEYELKGDIPDPPFFLAASLRKMLIHSGIPVSGEATTFRRLTPTGDFQTDGRTTVCTCFSPPLTDIIRETNVKSNNLYADHLLKLIALTVNPQASFERGVDAVKKFWKSNNLDMTKVVMYDGSGLSPVNRLSPAFVTQLLAYMSEKSKYATDFYTSLPLAGKEGTVRNFLKNTRLEEKIPLKSGSMTNVQCYAGYFDKDGKRYAFCIMANDYLIPRNKLQKAIEKMMLGW